MGAIPDDSASHDACTAYSFAHLLQMVRSLIGPRTKLVSLVHVSNMLGAVLPTEEVVAAAQKARPCLQ